ncbi:MAG: hypothetical protein PUA75_00875 [Clostridiales bacterium]|nr:hypothetical protein [Clostridiales bacterium]
MIVLRANSELKNTFERLIKTMGANVTWNGLFVVIDNCLILQGAVRSLFFHFDSRKVLENIIELPIKEEEICDTTDAARVQDVINIILYSFGKWGTIKGIRVEKNHEQLNRLFKSVLAEIGIEPEYTWEHFQFYQNGIRVTYEDVIQRALEASETALEEPEEEEGKGLWHKVAWKNAKVTFQKEETSLEERRSGRLGNNFYRIGYLCPDCGEKLHMVVYPLGREFKIETPEGAVLLARVCTCAKCNSFFTPRPEKMLSEGDIYRLDFDEDRKAYEDYLELLGKQGERVSNYRYNIFADGRRASVPQQESLEEVCENLEDCNEADLLELSDKMEEGFFSDESIARCEKKVREQLWLRGISSGRKSEAKRESADFAAKEKKQEEWKKSVHAKTDRIESDGNKSGDVRKKEVSGGSLEENRDRQSGTEIKKSAVENTASSLGVSEKEIEETKKKYDARFQVLDRLSDRQLSELKTQLSKEHKLPLEERQEYIKRIEERQNRQKAEKLNQKVENCAGKNYAILKRVYEEVKQEQLPDSMKEGLLERLREWMAKQAEMEVKTLMEKMPPNLDRARYKNYVERIRSYEGVDLSPYEETLRERRQTAEKQEVANIVNRARKNNRDDVAALIDKLKEGDFMTEILNPYLEKLEERLRKYDEAAVDELLGDSMHMGFEEGMQAYDAIAEGDFLPEIKDNALKMLKKRLSKIKTDECELLVKKLQDELTEAGVSENERHHFYPARKVLLNQALSEETEVIDFALASYAAGRGLFEYPIFVVDSSRNQTGKEGMILTPEHLYYSNLLTSFGMSIFSIDSITASTGLLNRGLYVKQKNGTKTKLPYVVEHKELSAFAGVLDSFVKYLQEKPDSRNVTYLAKEKHDTICCFRCGYMYKGGNICPKCGYKNNE